MTETSNDYFFSIIIPTYNRSAFLLKTIQSFIDQEYKNFELIIVDDGGSDNSGKVSKSFNDNRINYYWKENEERGAARNFGAKLAKGLYVNFFDSDDIAYPNHLQVAYDTIIAKKNPEIFHLGYDGKIGDKIIYRYNTFNGDILNYGIKKKRISINSLFIRKDVTQLVPFCEDRLLSVSEDALYVCQLAARHSFHYNNIITSTIVEHDKRSMVLAPYNQLKLRRDILLENLENDNIFMGKFGKYLKDIKKEYDYLLALSCLKTGNYVYSRKYFYSYLSFSLFSFLDIRSIVYVKKYIERLIKATNSLINTKSSRI